MKRFSKPFRSLLLAFLGAVVVLSWAISQGASNGSPPDPAPSPIPTHTPSRIPSQTPTVTHTPTLTSTPTHTATATPTQTATPTSPRTATIPRTGPVEQEPTSTALARSNDRSAAGFIPTYGYRIINTYPHDPEAFTQGLVFEAGVLYEGTGLQRRSTLRKVELETGEVLQLHTLPDEYFGEGITIYGDEIIQLTWQSHIGFVYDKDSFVQTGTFSYTTEGWGITHDGTHLIMSDGTPRLHFWDPETFEEVYWIEVHDSQGLVTRLNELEYIQGEIYANVWWTNLIAIIDPQTGQVTGWIDLTGLLSPEDYGGTVDVLNGIAYDAENDRLFVTGKLWPKLFEIELIPLPPQYVFLPFVGR